MPGDIIESTDSEPGSTGDPSRPRRKRFPHIKTKIFADVYSIAGHMEVVLRGYCVNRDIEVMNMLAAALVAIEIEKEDAAKPRPAVHKCIAKPKLEFEEFAERLAALLHFQLPDEPTQSKTKPEDTNVMTIATYGAMKFGLKEEEITALQKAFKDRHLGIRRTRFGNRIRVWDNGVWFGRSVTIPNAMPAP